MSYGLESCAKVPPCGLHDHWIHQPLPARLCPVGTIRTIAGGREEGVTVTVQLQRIKVLAASGALLKEIAE